MWRQVSFFSSLFIIKISARNRLNKHPSIKKKASNEGLVLVEGQLRSCSNWFGWLCVEKKWKSLSMATVEKLWNSVQGELDLTSKEKSSVYFHCLSTKFLTRLFSRLRRKFFANKEEKIAFRNAGNFFSNFLWLTL